MSVIVRVIMPKTGEVLEYTIKAGAQVRVSAPKGSKVFVIDTDKGHVVQPDKVEEVGKDLVLSVNAAGETYQVVLEDSDGHGVRVLSTDPERVGAAPVEAGQSYAGYLVGDDSKALLWGAGLVGLVGAGIALFRGGSDKTPPAAPTVTNVTELQSDPNPNDLLSNDNTQVLTVTGEKGATLKVYSSTGTLVPVANYKVTDADGTYTVDFGSNVLGDGKYVVTLTDRAGNESAASGAFTIDTTPPAAPAAGSPGALSLTAATDTGTTGDLRTAAPKPVLTFDGEPGLTVTLKGPDGSTLDSSQYTVTYTGSTYTVTLKDAQTGAAGEQGFGTYGNGGATGNPASSADGTYSIVAKDAAGNSGTIGTFVIDTTPPAAPAAGSPGALVLTAPTDTGATGDLRTAAPKPVLTFNGEAGLTVTLKGPDGSTLDPSQYTVSYTGSTYTVTLKDAQTGAAGEQGFGTYGNGAATGNPASSADGTYSIVAKDAAGNSGTIGTFVIDTTAPAGPVTVVTQTTSDTTPVITGTATLGAGESLTVTVNGATYNVTVTAGSWSLDLGTATPVSGSLTALTNGNTYPVTATITDAAGNVLSDSSTNELTIDTGLTVGPLDMTDATDSGSSQSDELTNNGHPVLTFTGEAGLTIALKGPDNTTLTAGTHYSVSYSAGTYTVTLLDAKSGGTATDPFGTYSGGSATGNPASTADGTYTITATDAASNTGTVGTFVIDTTVPAGPVTVVTQTTADTTPVITGTATLGAGESLTVTVSGATYSVTPSGGTWSLDLGTATPVSGTLTALTNGSTYPVTATITDAAGNVLSDSSTNELTISAPANLAVIATIYFNEYQYFRDVVADPVATRQGVSDSALLTIFNQAVLTGSNQTDGSTVSWDFDGDSAWGAGTSLPFNGNGNLTGQSSGRPDAVLFSLNSQQGVKLQTTLENDSAFAGTVADTLDFNAGTAETLAGGTFSDAQADVVAQYYWKISETGQSTSGTAAQDFTGGSLTDHIIGSANANVITGGGGADQLTGLGGADTFVFNAGDSTTTAYDVITDFVAAAGGDKLDLVGTPVDKGVYSGPALASLADGIAWAQGAATATGDVAAFQYNGSTYVFQENGGATDDLLIQLQNVTGITSLSTISAGAGTVWIA